MIITGITAPGNIVVRPVIEKKAETQEIERAIISVKIPIKIILYSYF
jgi:hypothetical protein